MCEQLRGEDLFSYLFGLGQDPGERVAKWSNAQERQDQDIGLFLTSQSMLGLLIVSTTCSIHTSMIIFVPPLSSPAMKLLCQGNVGGPLKHTQEPI